MTPQEMIAVIQAYLDGEEIEFCQYGEAEWHACTFNQPQWNFCSNTYRVKSKVNPSINWDHVDDKYKWLVVDGDGTGCLYTDKPTFYAADELWMADAGECAKVTAFKSFDAGTMKPEDSLTARPLSNA